MWPNPQFPADLITFTEEILNGKLRFCAVMEVAEQSWSFKKIFEDFISSQRILKNWEWNLAYELSDEQFN